MELLVLKLVLTPVFIGGATLAARRWGSGVGGWLAALPLTSGPVSIFLALEHGARFAADAASATLLGLIGVAAFCVVYATVARERQWRRAAVLGLTAFLAATWILRGIAPASVASFVLACGALLLAARLIRVRKSEAGEGTRPRWDILLRMLAATTVVIAITALASLLGPRWSGLLSPLPVFACIMAAFSQRQDGAAAASRLLHGVVMGSFAFACFFLVVALSLDAAGLAVAYGCASLAALIVQSLTMDFVTR